MASLLRRLFPDQKQDAPSHVNTSRKKTLDELLHDSQYDSSFPRTNYSPDTGYKEIPYLEPRYFALEQHSHKIFAQRLADVRWRFDQHWKVTGLLGMITALMAQQKCKYTLAMTLPISTALFSWIYHYDLAYGNMVSRINQECQYIITEEGKKKYFLSDEEISKNAEQAVEGKKAVTAMKKNSQ